MENPEFLKEKYNLHKSEEVESAAQRAEARAGEQVPQNPADRIQNYLDRFNEILDRKDPDKRERGIEALKHILHNKFVIKPEEIPEGYFENQRRIAREQGHGDIEITDEMRGQLSEVIVADQESSLDKWIDYLASPDATYPDWLKYYATRSILGMGEYSKERKEFTKRSKGTTKPFPDLNREALAYVLDAVEKKHQGEKFNLTALENEDKEKFEKILQGENFSKLYAWAIEKVTPESQDQLTITKGEWIKYDQGSDHMPLVVSLQGHGTGWCTAGESTAEAQLEGGDFYVYYSLDQQGQPTIPRVAIRMQENGIAEVRGIATEQNLDPHIGGVVQEKLKEFSDGAVYEKKTQDMKILTAVENKVRKGLELSKDDLSFIYEINAPIEGFGYQKDPRIAELRQGRNTEEDMLVIFECTKEQIAHVPSQINENTKAYVGQLEPGIFDLIQQYDIEHVYTSFPENKIRRENIEVGGKTVKQLKDELKHADIAIFPDAENILDRRKFIPGKNPEEITLVRLTIASLGLKTRITTDQIYERAQTLGLVLCPVDTGPHYLLKHQNQALQRVYVAMKPIAGFSVVSVIELEGDGVFLGMTSAPARANMLWPSRYEFMFRLRKSES
ncbi:MAG: hypothetical protein AAB911_02035 [Patescibacteria group bacterium]